MNRTRSLTPRTALTVAWLLGTAVAVGGSVLPAEAAPARTSVAETRSVTTQAAYLCQFLIPDVAEEDDTVSVQMQLDVPTAVSPGDTVVLRGSFKMQFSEQTRQELELLGADTVDAYSATLSTYRTLGGQAGPYFADRWQTGPTPVRNPFEVQGALSFPAFTVPAGATGSMKLQMMQNGTTPNTATDEPAKVAFTVVAKAYGPATSYDIQVACFLQRPNPAILAEIPVRAVAAAPPASSAGSSGGTSTPSGSPGQESSDPGVAAAPAGPGRESAAGAAPLTAAAPLSEADGSPEVGSSPTGLAPAFIDATAAPDAGVYLPTGLLVLGVFGFCLVTLGYAALASHRLRAMRRALDG